MKIPYNTIEDGISKSVLSHYRKESVSNLLVGGSQVLATSVIEIYEVSS